MQTFWYRRLLLKDKAALSSIEREVEGKVKVRRKKNIFRARLRLRRDGAGRRTGVAWERGVLACRLCEGGSEQGEWVDGRVGGWVAAGGQIGCCARCHTAPADTRGGNRTSPLARMWSSLGEGPAEHFPLPARSPPPPPPRAQYNAADHHWKKLMMLVAQLRKCCNHPYLFPGAEPDFDGESTGARAGGRAGGRLGLVGGWAGERVSGYMCWRGGLRHGSSEGEAKGQGAYGSACERSSASGRRLWPLLTTQLQLALTPCPLLL